MAPKLTIRQTRTGRWEALDLRWVIPTTVTPCSQSSREAVERCLTSMREAGMLSPDTTWE